jgi:amidase
VESVDPLWPGDPSIEKMKPSYTEALAQLVPVFFPDILYRLTGNGQPQFPEFAAKIKPTEFAPGKTFGTGTMKPIDYMVELAEGRMPIPKSLNIRAIEEVVESNAFTFHFNQYAMRRAADWKARGFVETLTDFAKLNARSKFWGDDQRAAFKDWEEMDDMRQTLGQRQGIDEHIMMRELLRRVEMKVLYENHLDAVVRLHYSLPPGKIGLAPQPRPPDDIRGELRMGPFAGVTEVLIPAGYVRTAYDPVFVLSADKKSYIPTTNNTATDLPAPGLPFSLVFRAEPGKEDVILKIASAYEAASKRRVPPPSFGPLPGEP